MFDPVPVMSALARKSAALPGTPRRQHSAEPQLTKDATRTVPRSSSRRAGRTGAATKARSFRGERWAPCGGRTGAATSILCQRRRVHGHNGYTWRDVYRHAIPCRRYQADRRHCPLSHCHPVPLGIVPDSTLLSPPWLTSHP
jgi:hypothetical protein